MKDEDTKLIYEFCGFRLDDCGLWNDPYGYPVATFPIGNEPILGPNFYTEYAVPKLDRVSIAINNEYLGKRRNKIRILHNHSFYDGMDEDLTEAFGQALLSLIKEKK